MRNVTDVDDDILRKARELGVHYLDLAAEEMARFDAEMRLLNLLPVYSEPRATSAIPEILSLDRCGARFAATPIESGGSVYFDVASFPAFGRLSGYGRSDMLELAAEHGGQPRRSQQAGPAGLRALAALAARRAGLGVPLGSGPAGLAHRVLGPGPA